MKFGIHFKITRLGNYLAIQWLGLCAFTAKGPSSIYGHGTKISQTVQCSQKSAQAKGRLGGWRKGRIDKIGHVFI